MFIGPNLPVGLWDNPMYVHLSKHSRGSYCSELTHFSNRNRDNLILFSSSRVEMYLGAEARRPDSALREGGCSA